MAGRAVAAFDFDGTLTRSDTLLPFLRRACGTAPTARALAASALPLARSIVTGNGRHQSKEALLVRLLGGRDQAELALTAEAFADVVVARLLRTGMSRRVEWHRRAGHQLVIVSASPELYVAPVGRRLGFDAVLATRLELGPAGRLTGRLEGLNCRGSEKVARLRGWLGEEPVVVYAYGDSAGDRELLELAHWGARVGRGRNLPQAPIFS